MFPVLLELGPLTLHSYGLFIALGFLTGLWWTAREAQSRGLDPALVQDLGFYAILFALIGSRILYVLLSPGYYLAHPLEALMFWQGGLVFQGGAIAVVLALWVILRRGGQPILPWADAFMPGLALGQFFGRLGCLAAGCCYGKACDLPWAITFTDPRALAPLNVPLHPTQLYDALGELLAFLLLRLLSPRLRHRPGRLAGIYLLYYAPLRIGTELLRADFRGHLGDFTPTQAIALGLAILGVWLVLRPAEA